VNRSFAKLAANYRGLAHQSGWVELAPRDVTSQNEAQERGEEKTQLRQAEGMIQTTATADEYKRGAEERRATGTSGAKARVLRPRRR